MSQPITLDQGQHAAIRDLDAIIARLEDLRVEDWGRQTPCEGWDIRSLAEHLASTSQQLATALWNLVKLRTGSDFPGEPVPGPGKNETSTDLIVRLIHSRNQLNQTLSFLNSGDLDVVLMPGEEDGPVHNGQRMLAIASCEQGIHRFDLETAMGKKYAGLSSDVINAAELVFGSTMVWNAKRSGHTPDAPWSLRLVGDSLDHTLTWDGSAWSDQPVSGVPVTEVHTDNSGVVLFATGRITVDDHRIRIKGDKAVAAQFKTFVPGP